MQVKQIAQLLNTIYGEIIGEDTQVAEDLSNIVSVGQTITSSTQFGENFDNYVAKIIDKVGLTIYGTKAYRGTAPDIIRYGVDFGSVVEKIRVDVPDYTENPAWMLTATTAPDFSDIFDFVPATVSATYYNMAVTFRVKISIPEYQLRSAFTSAAEMTRFINTIELRIMTKMTMAQDALKKRAIANLIAEKMVGGRNVVNLVTEYNTQAAAGQTVTAANALRSREFLRYASERIGIDRGMLREETGLFNNSTYVTHTDDADLKMIFLSDFAKSLESSLYADTFNADYVKQDGYSEVAWWQSPGTSGAYADRSKIIVNPASDNTKTVTAGGIIAVMFDKDACFIAGEYPTTKALPNPDGDFTNFFHKWKASYYNDTAENAIVYVLQDPVITEG